MKPRKKGQSSGLSEKSFRALIENAHEGIVIYDESGRIKFATRSIKKVCGYNEHEVIGMSGVAFVHPEDLESGRESFRKLIQQKGKTLTLVQRLRHKKGHYILAESQLTNFLHIPEINGIVSNFRDITERKRAEEESAKTKRLLETINENLSEGIYMGVIGTSFLYVNDAFLKIFGFRSIKEVQKIKPAAVYANDDHRKRIVEILLKKRVLKNEETLFRRKNGKIFWGLLNVTMLKDPGSADYFVGTIRDISSEKETQHELIESHNFLNNIINTVAAPIFVKDARHRWILFNKKFADLVGRTNEELMGKTDRDFLPPLEAKIFWRIDNEVLNKGKIIWNEERITSAKGDVHEIITVKSRYINERKEKFIIGFISDITHIKRAEEKINQLNANLVGVMESTKESIYAIDSSYRYITFNQNHKRIMKALYDSEIDIGVHKLASLKKSKDRLWVKEELDKALSGQNFISEHFIHYPKFKGYIQTSYNPIRDKNGNVRGAAVFVNNVTERREFEEIIKSINSRLQSVVESTSDHVLAVDRNFRYVMFNKAHAQGFKTLFDKVVKSGQSILDILSPELRTVAKREISRALGGEYVLIEEQLMGEDIFEVSLNPIRDEKKDVTGVAIFARDITQRKKIEAEMNALNEELIQQNVQLAEQEAKLKATLDELSERNFEMDQLMYKTSHDLRSPLSSIMGLVNLANLDDNPLNQNQYLSKIEGRIKKLDEFIKSMLDYARVNRVSVSKEKVDLQKLAANCIHELEYLENFKNVKTEIKVSGDHALFSSDILRLNIIFGNIISNAYKYYNPEAQSFLRINITVNPFLVKLEFKDNGIGIKPEHMDKIFNMFYRATDKSQGSGLGMYIVKQAVEKLNGSIAINSEFGKGTTIKISLPQ